MIRNSWLILSAVLATAVAGRGHSAAFHQEAASEDLFPLAIGSVWKYEAQEHGERTPDSDGQARTTVVRRIVGSRKIRLTASEEVDAFEIEVVVLMDRQGGGRPGDQDPLQLTSSREFAVAREDRVEIYLGTRDGKTGEEGFQRIQQWPRTRPSGREFEELLWQGRGGQRRWKVSDADFDLPYDKGKGIKLRWMSEGGEREEGIEAVLAPGVGIVSYRSAILPCRGLYSDHRERLVSYEKPKEH